MTKVLNGILGHGFSLLISSCNFCRICPGVVTTFGYLRLSKSFHFVGLWLIGSITVSAESAKVFTNLQTRRNIISGKHTKNYKHLQ